MNDKYCFWCGEELVRDNKPWSYDTSTREPRYRWYCPKWNGWKFWESHETGYGLP